MEKGVASFCRGRMFKPKFETFAFFFYDFETKKQQHNNEKQT